ncbi:hypothetical protein FRC07_013901, partial [Ceratobasidium sp. 392]
QDTQVQSKGPLSGMVSIARDMLGRKPTTETPAETNANPPEQPAANATSQSNNP